MKLVPIAVKVNSVVPLALEAFIVQKVLLSLLFAKQVLIVQVVLPNAVNVQKDIFVLKVPFSPKFVWEVLMQASDSQFVQIVKPVIIVRSKLLHKLSAKLGVLVKQNLLNV